MAQMFYPAEGFDGVKLEGKVLIVPSVSLANLPQLAVDILITSLGLRKVGVVGDGTTVAPFVGAGEDGELVTGGLTLYGRAENDVFFLQQRSPVLKTKKDEHVKLLSDFIKQSKFDCTLILTSLDAANQDDAQLQTPHQSLLQPRTSTIASHPLLGRLRRLPPYSIFLEMLVGLTSGPPEVDSPNGIPGPHAPYPPFLPSAGLTRRLLQKLQEDENSHGTLAAWCVEGDNRGDAMGLAAVVLQLLDLVGTELREPSSWKGLFGAVDGWSGGQGADSELYG